MMGDTARKVDSVFLGRNCGLRVSNICLGTMPFADCPEFDCQNNEIEAQRILDRFVELGGNFIDTANCYSDGKSEEYIGNWLKKRQDRHKLVISTKVRTPLDLDDPNAEGVTRKHILTEVENSLRRLQTDYIDLYQMHYWDDGTPITETLSTMNDLVMQGKIRYFGASNLSGWQLQKIVEVNRHFGYSQCVSIQLEYSLLQRFGEIEVFEVCKREGVAVLPWSPLKSGLLTGKYKKGRAPPEGSRYQSILKNPDFWTWACEKHFTGEKAWNVLDTLDAISKEAGKTPSQVALRWLLQRPAVTSVIISAKNLVQLEDNMAAGSGWSLSEEQMNRLTEVTKLDPCEFYDMLRDGLIGRQRELPGGY